MASFLAFFFVVLERYVVARTLGQVCKRRPRRFPSRGGGRAVNDYATSKCSLIQRLKNMELILITLPVANNKYKVDR